MSKRDARLVIFGTIRVAGLAALLGAPAGAEPSIVPLSQRSQGAEGGTLFTEIAAADSGIDFINPIDTDHPLKRVYTSAFGGGGVAAGDLDGDGRCDLYFVSGPRGNRFYRNLGGGRFEDATQKAGVGGGEAWGGGAAIVDIDGDGDLDIYVCNYESPNQLFVNDGTGAFIESARAFGLDLARAYLTAAFADYDLDGDLDVYLLGHRHYRQGGRPTTGVTVMKDGKPQMLPDYEDYYGIMWRGGKTFEINNVGARDVLLRNDGGRFVDVSGEAGIAPDRNQGNSVTWWDYNHDGLPDLYVGNDFEAPDLLYRNNGNGTFTDVAKRQLPHTTWFTMGADCGDINNDGLMDFFSADMAGTSHYKSKTTMGIMGSSQWFMLNADPPQYMRNCLYVNTGTGRFLDAAPMAGVASSDWTWAVKFGDLDCDGRIDLFTANGVTRSFNDSDKPLEVAKLVGNTEWDLYEDAPARPEENLAYRNLGDLAFEKVGEAWGLDQLGMNYAAAYFDLEGDGDLDLAVTNLDKPPSILRNDAQAGSRIVFRLEGEGGNRFGIGAELRIETADGVQVRQFNPMRGFCSGDEPLVHFGLGDADGVDRLTVRWPGGKVSTLENLAADKRYTVSASEAKQPEVKPEIESDAPLFARADALRGARHWEAPFDDFALQPLLPNRQSQWGPGLACGDFDGDGDDDLFLGGAAGRIGQLLINDGAGRMEAVPLTAAERHRASEDMGALFFDANGDGDLDLYVVSGSVEAPPGDPTLVDRLYLNDGKGKFSAARFGSVPLVADSGGPVGAADYDRDGDLDLFVGGRVTPGAYPVGPRSRLLENRGGRFSDVSFKTPAFAKVGMVTGVLWSDADGDGWVDLLLSTEWGPLRLFRNVEGKLVEATEEAGLALHTGWWTGVNGADIDNDGDIDYLATNFGLNTKYHASADEPELIFHGDLEGTGRKRIIEAGFEHGVCYPHRGFSCSRNAMPFLDEKLKTFHKYASSTLGSIYTDSLLKDALRLEVNTLESGIFINDGKGVFRFQPLPRLAQISPSFGSAFMDADGDGALDIFLAQNFYGPQIETRPMDDGLGALLLGDGVGGFTAAWPARSGVVIPEDAMSAVPIDIDNDGRGDLVIGVNDGPAVALVNRTGPAPLAVRLVGPKGNPTGVGARVTVDFGAGRKRTAEVTAGGGYLSQAPAVLRFAVPEGGVAQSVTVRWPDGETTSMKVKAGARELSIAR